VFSAASGTDTPIVPLACRRVLAVVQRVSRAAVRVDDELVAAIGRGLLVLVGVAEDDDERDCELVARRIRNLRLFPSERRPLDLALDDVAGEILCVSQFTLLADTRKGRRPSFERAAPPERARPLYERVVELLGARSGRFGAHMAVELVNDGPVTVIVDSRRGR